MHSHSPSWFVLSSSATANIGLDALVSSAIFTAVAMIMVGLRWGSRMCSPKGTVGVEDYFVTVALVFSIGFTAAIGGEFGLDGGRIETDQAEVQLSSLSTMLKLVFAQSIFYHLSINLVKASFILQFTRLFSVITPVVYSCHILLVLIFGAACWGVFGVIFLCNPVQRYWEFMVPGTCLNAENHFYSTSIIGIVLDWAIWILPIPVLGGLRLPRRQKIGLMGVFGLGGFVCVVSILRLVLVHDAAHHNQVTRSGTFALIFSTIEINVAIICASLLVMKPLLTRFIPALVAEEPMSASEDRRIWRALTGLSLLEQITEDEEKEEHDRRRDTGIGMGRNSMRDFVPSDGV
ncbi:hypothetical protein IQ07DRAFT_650204 [Pyrenochaeta sp. DS3sAY3a]|nr:hypothetical protein IQ07DRAFT_650204 [Pyrenochaeta sp. DS3sAY3a]